MLVQDQDLEWDSECFECGKEGTVRAEKGRASLAKLK
ncbi:hypothetical protein KIPB_015662, partial [Kipferlia bialata]|eukprot:g15662.t1